MNLNLPLLSYRPFAWPGTGPQAIMGRAKAGRAADNPDERDWPADHDGSAKVALLGIERSHAARLELVPRGLASPSEVEPFIADLICLSDELERVFPKARVFVRPGFDERTESPHCWCWKRGDHDHDRPLSI